MLLLVVGFGARGLNVGLAVPMMGLIVVALVIVDRRVVAAASDEASTSVPTDGFLAGTVSDGFGRLNSTDAC